MVKRLHAGRAAQSGMLAALLAKRGFTGISDVVEASYGGFLSSFSRTPNVERLLDGLGDGLGGRQDRLQDVSECHQHSRRTRRAAIDPRRRRRNRVADRGNPRRLWSHDVRAYRLGVPSGRGHCRADEHVLRPQRDGAAPQRIGWRLFRRRDRGPGNSRVHAADQDCRRSRDRRSRPFLSARIPDRRADHRRQKLQARSVAPCAAARRIPSADKRSRKNSPRT